MRNPPLGAVCPCCKEIRTRPDSWCKGPYDETICKTCLREMDKIDYQEFAPPPNQFETLPSNCPRCNRDMSLADRRSWVLSADGLLCRTCMCDTSRLAVGEVRADYKNRCFEVGENRIAKYPFGERKIPLWSQPALRSHLVEQKRLMWELTKENVGIAWKVALGFVTRGKLNQCDVEDAVHDACIPALMRAAIDFDAKRARFSTVAWVSCKNAMVSYIKRRTKLRCTERQVLEDEMNNAKEEESHSAFKDEEAIQEATQTLELIWPLLSETDAEVMRMRFVDGMTYEAIGIAYGVLPQAIYLRVKRVRLRCLQELKQSGT